MCGISSMSNHVYYKKYMIGWITLQHDHDCRFRVRAMLGFGRSVLEPARARSENISTKDVISLCRLASAVLDQSFGYSDYKESHSRPTEG